VNEEMKKALEALRAEIGKNVEAAARIDAVAAAATQAGADIKALRAELDAIKAANTERQNAIVALQQQGRVQRLDRTPAMARQESLRMLGMIVRQELARHNRMELPAAFREETALVEAYRSECAQRATITPLSTTGSYLVPTVTEASITDGLEEVSEFMSQVDLIPGLPAGGTFNFTFLSTRPTMQAKRASTDTAMTASDPVFAQLQISVNETYVFFPIDNKLFLMSPVPLGTYFQGLCRDAMIAKLVYWLLRADGTATYNSLTGLLNEATAGYIYTLPGGKTSFGDLAAQDLTKIKSQTLKRGRGARGRWIMNLDIQSVVEDMDRTGKLPVIRESEAGEIRIKTNPVLIEEDMPGLDESAGGTAFAAFGDPATLLMAMVGGIQIASDASVKFDKNQTAFRGTTIMGFGRKPVNTLTVIKTAGA
jgi:HK97 family phage major capsid protein